MVKKLFALTALLIACPLFAQGTNTASDNDNALLTEYVKSKGNGIIIFDASNIKQFWIDKSVVSKKDSFEIVMNEKKERGFESVPLRIQLANVNETMDCNIEVIADVADCGFSVLNDSNKAISVSSAGDKFLHYSIVSSVFHLEDTLNTSFKILFHSKTENILSFKKIILSFSDNKNSRFLASPGVLKITHDIITVSSAQISESNQSSFSVIGKRSRVLSAKRILLTNNTLSSSVTIKNTGSEDTQVYVGYIAYAKDKGQLDGKNYPYKNNNNILSIVSSLTGSNKIIVDSFPEWAKNCYLAIDAKEDISDIPCKTFLDGRISEVRKLENGHAEITLDKPLKAELAKGTKIRVHGQGGSFLYTSYKLIHPGEELVFNSTVQKDDSSVEYSAKAFPKGVYSVIPVILSYSSDSNKDNTIIVRDYLIHY